MPIYEFECENCGKLFEYYMPVDMDRTYVGCTECQARCNKIISAPAVIKNFEDYYETDIGDKPVLVRTRQDLKDSLAKYNDTEQASKTGNLAVY